MKCVEIRTEVTTRNRKNKKISVSKTLSEIKEGTVEMGGKLQLIKNSIKSQSRGISVFFLCILDTQQLPVVA